MIRQYVFTLSRRLPEGSMTTCTCRQHLNCRLSRRQFSFDILFCKLQAKTPVLLLQFFTQKSPAGCGFVLYYKMSNNATEEHDYAFTGH